MADLNGVGGIEWLSGIETRDVWQDAERHVRKVMIEPFVHRNRRIDTARVRSHYSDTEWNASNDRIPLGRPGAVEDVAEAVAYLASDAAKHVTGQTLHVNGGRIMT